MKVIWSPQAEADLVDVWTYIAADRRNAADAVEARILDAVDGLGELPHRGRLGKAAGTRELVVSRTPYIVIYRLQEQGLEIVRLWHGSRGTLRVAPDGRTRNAVHGASVRAV